MYRDHFRGALLGTFLGDALGMPLEGTGQLRYGHGEVRDLLHARLGRGTYTDDTQLMIGLAEALLDTPGRLSLDRLAARFGEIFDPRRGYGGNAMKILASIGKGTPWRQAVERHLLPGGSYANGAAMRVAPVALAFFGDEEATARAAREQGEVTGHGHPVGAFGAELLALAIHRALQHGAAKEPFDAAEFAAPLRPRAVDEFRYALEWIPENLDAEPGLAVQVLGNGLRASHSVSFALWCFLAREDDPEEAIVRAVNAGGDTDTIGAMTGALAGAYHGASSLPARWVEPLENGERGRDYVLGLADRLLEARA